MCGIVGAIGEGNVIPILLQGLQRLEYRGYDSCGIGLMHEGLLKRVRTLSRVADLRKQLENIESPVGVAHTRWATHGVPSEANAHPHFSRDEITVVHNGIIENHEELRAELKAKGYEFTSQTDTEVIAHLIDSVYNDGFRLNSERINLMYAVQQVLPRLKGAYAIAVVAKDANVLIGARQGSPLVLGIGEGANYLASDAMALAGVSDQIIYLEEGDSVEIEHDGFTIYNDGLIRNEERPIKQVTIHSGQADLGDYRHYMQKEIFEQPAAIAATLDSVTEFTPTLFGADAARIFDEIDRVLILACGTSYYAGCVAKYWLEAIAGVPCNIEVASEYRYRKSVPDPRTLIVTISQSGETADTMAALKHAKSLGMDKSLTICNVATSAMVRECKLAYITRAGAEIGVASTKAFTTQLVALFLLTMTLKKIKFHTGSFSTLEEQQAKCLDALRHLPVAVQSVLALEPQIIAWSEKFANKQNALFLGRGHHYPIALEGALKLKEISYIHAEAYSAGELKHGPLALVTSEMPVVVVAPNDELIDKLKSNMQEVRARGGELFVFADAGSKVESDEGTHVIRMPENYGSLSPILHVVALQLLAYHTACIRGTDVDKPRNLAKSVTVE